MNLSQLQYIIALDDHRHFVTAAEKCFVAQATLSMMVKKLEEELGVKIFDRTAHPVKPTREGEQVIIRARQILSQAEGLVNFAHELRGDITGTLHLGVIPTLAPYLLPLFLRAFAEKHSGLRVFVRELVTADIISRLKAGELDIGLLAAPLNEPLIEERHLFYEEFYAYTSKDYQFSKKKYLLPKDVSPRQLWLLEEGHCMRNQVFNLCELKKHDLEKQGVHYEAGSIETLVNMVDRNGGITIIPQLAAGMLKPTQKKNLREFAHPKPVREIILATSMNYPRKKITEELAESILDSVPPELLRPSKRIIVA